MKPIGGTFCSTFPSQRKFRHRPLTVRNVIFEPQTSPACALSPLLQQPARILTLTIRPPEMFLPYDPPGPLNVNEPFEATAAAAAVGRQHVSPASINSEAKPLYCLSATSAYYRPASHNNDTTTCPTRIPPLPFQNNLPLSRSLSPERGRSQAAHTSSDSPVSPFASVLYRLRGSRSGPDALQRLLTTSPRHRQAALSR